MQKVLLKRSNVINSNNMPKLPTQSQIDYGELAINYAKGVECISTKNSSGDIVTFKEDVHVGNSSDAAILARLPNLFIDTINNVAKYKTSMETYANLPPIPTYTYEKEYTGNTSAITISQTNQEVILANCASGTYDFSVEKLALNRIHIIIYAMSSYGSVVINFPKDDENYVTFGYDNLTVSSGDYGEISVIQVGTKYFIQSA